MWHLGKKGFGGKVQNNRHNACHPHQLEINLIVRKTNKQLIGSRLFSIHCIFV